MYFLIVSGMSGAGKSRTVATLEDFGFYCVDNLPIALIPKFAEICLAATERYERVALVTDVRAGGDFQQLFDSLDAIRDMGCDYRILFLDTATGTLINRFKETRRKHPLMEDGVSMTDAIMKERALLEGVRGKADYVVDTTNLSTGGLRDKLIKLFANENDDLLEVTVQSFGFKYGIPPEADLVFDVRFLPNPYYVQELRPRTGLDDGVRDYVFSGGAAGEFLEKLQDLVGFLLPKYVEEGKTALVVAVGCTGGHHRSVAIAHALAAYIRGRGYPVTESHRDLGRT